MYNSPEIVEFEVMKAIFKIYKTKAVRLAGIKEK